MEVPVIEITLIPTSPLSPLTLIAMSTGAQATVDIVRGVAPKGDAGDEALHGTVTPCWPLAS
jgi:hypothetical protein